MCFHHLCRLAITGSFDNNILLCGRWSVKRQLQHQLPPLLPPGSQGTLHQATPQAAAPRSQSALHKAAPQAAAPGNHRPPLSRSLPMLLPVPRLPQLRAATAPLLRDERSLQLQKNALYLGFQIAQAILNCGCILSL